MIWNEKRKETNSRTEYMISHNCNKPTKATNKSPELSSRKGNTVREFPTLRSIHSNTQNKQRSKHGKSKWDHWYIHWCRWCKWHHFIVQCDRKFRHVHVRRTNHTTTPFMWPAKDLTLLIKSSMRYKINSVVRTIFGWKSPNHRWTI